MIAEGVDGRNHAQCLQRWNKVLKPGLVKGHWSYDEDNILKTMVLRGCSSWGQVSASIPGRTQKQCRERWKNHLDPRIIRTPFTPAEDQLLQESYAELGNRWSKIADIIPGRTEESVKARWKFLNPQKKSSSKPGRPRALSKNRTDSLLRRQEKMPDVIQTPTSQAGSAESETSDLLGCMSLENIDVLASFSDILPTELLSVGDIDSLLQSNEFEQTLVGDPGMLDSFKDRISKMENSKEHDLLHGYLVSVEQKQQHVGFLPTALPDENTTTFTPYLPPGPAVDSPKFYVTQQRTLYEEDKDGPSSIELATNGITDVSDMAMLQSFSIKKN